MRRKRNNNFNRIKSVITLLALSLLLSIPVYAAVKTRGDVYDEGDAIVDIKDALFLSSYLYGETSLDSTGMQLADANHDGSVNAADVKVITDYVVGNITNMPEIDVGAENLFTLSSGSGQPGDTVTLSLNLGGQVNLCAYQLVINYDSQALEFVDMTAGDSVLSNHIAKNSEIRVSYINSNDENETNARNILDITFMITGTNGIAAIDITTCDAWLADETAVPTSSIGGQVVIG